MQKTKTIQPPVTPRHPMSKLLIRGWLQNVLAALRHQGILLCFLLSPAWGSETCRCPGKRTGKGWEVCTIISEDGEELRRHGRQPQTLGDSSVAVGCLSSVSDMSFYLAEICLLSGIRDEPVSPLCALEILRPLVNGLSPDLYPRWLLVWKKGLHKVPPPHRLSCHTACCRD